MRPVPRCAAQLEKQGSPHPSARPLIARVWPCGPPSASLPRPRTVPASLLVAALVPGSAAPAPRPAPRWPGWMAPQRRGPLRTPEGSGATERRRPSSTKKDRELRETWRGWLKTLGLGASVVLASILIWSSLGADDGVAEVLAHRDEILEGKFIEVPCSEDYDGHRRFEGCTPRKCGRGVTDVVISREEAERIRRVAEKGLSLGGSDGGASILDLHSGALSIGKHFVNLYRYFGDKIQTIFSEEDFQLYRDVRRKVQLTIAEAFGISASSLYLTKPTFFSRINSTEARTAHDEYWHAHVDKVGFLSSPRGLRICTVWRRSAGVPVMPSPSPSPATLTMALRTRPSRSPGPESLPASLWGSRHLEAWTTLSAPGPARVPIAQSALRIITSPNLLVF
ncbi:2-oxoglutarate and iron-dependent oxygenase domain-containing protein 3 isoform X2 [Octodon degus]|uniref:2-oxoglutarate and iron-dependent oxygenase domain-containing protein 3 isoform X2 n=1 Tax=Octodon degus TaxID=10160 RepID=A0A6P6D5Y2_OCTDE|nr:2-oxoglutarate and iron-dependent oxygenase domain-containing protein 3 isoform X2 [Octodon degus]